VRKLAGLLLLVLIVPVASLAHELRPAIADIRFGEGTVEMEIRITAEALIAGIDPALNDTRESENAARYDALRAMPPAELQQEFRLFEPRFRDGLKLFVDGERLEVSEIALQVPEVGDLALVRDSMVALRADIPAGAREMTFGWTEEFGPVIIRVTTPEGEDGYSAYLKNGAESDPFSVEGVTPQSAWSVFVDYIGIGYVHILPLGIDHILFVVGLFLLSAHLKPLLWQVSAFTLAHTISLALGMLGIVTVPASIVEPLIAASIVYVGVENMLVRGLNPWRPAVIFVFGLLHGLGFAGVLSEVGLPQAQFIESLIGFNVGVELGQLTVIGICFLTVGFWFGNKSWYRKRISVPLSLVISLIASYWFIERTFL